MFEIAISTYIFGLVYFSLLWIISLATKRASVIDIGWGFFFICIAFFYISNFSFELSFYHYLALVLIGLWSVRLGGYLLIRYIYEDKEDKRYVKIKKEWKATNFSFIKMFLFQGFIASSLSFPIYFIFSYDVSNIFIFYTALVIGLLSIFLESLADYQLFSFKKNKDNKGKVCTKGLWNLSRHPNYFFEWLIWFSLFVLCVSISFKGSFSIYAVIFMYLTLNHISGIPFLEEDARKGIFKKEGEKEYYQNTPAFFPDITKIFK